MGQGPFKRARRRMHAVVVAIEVLIVVQLMPPQPVSADLLGHGGMVRAVAVSPDGLYALSGSFDFSAILWDFGEQAELAVLDGHDAPVNDVAFFGDSQRAVTVSDDGAAIIWSLADARNPQIVHRLKSHTHKVMAVAVSPSDDHIATGGWDKTVRLWDTVSGLEVLVIETDTPVNAVSFSKDGRWLAIGGHDGRIRLWERAQNRFASVF